MGALAIMVLAFAGYIIMYQLYGKYIGNKIFALSGAAKTPAVELEDGVDYTTSLRLPEPALLSDPLSLLSGAGCRLCCGFLSVVL